MSEQILRPMSDGKRPAGTNIFIPGRGSRNTLTVKGWHRFNPYYIRCGMKRPGKTRQQHRRKAFILGQLIQREVYANSIERKEMLAIGKRLARKLGFAYRMLHITTGMVIGLFFFGTIHSLANPATMIQNASCNNISIVSLREERTNMNSEKSLEALLNLNRRSVNGLQKEDSLTDFTSDTLVRSFVLDNMSIVGKVTESGSSNPVSSAKIVVVNELNAKRLDSTYTNTAGEYALDVTWTNLPDAVYLKAISYPNPYTDKTNIELYVQSSKNYSLRAFDATGKLILNQNLDLKSGTNLISITGGKPGINIINLTNGKETHTYKAVKAQGTDEQLSASVKITDPVNSFDATNTSTNGSLKSGEPNVLSSGDYVRLLYTKEGFYDKDTVFVISPNQTINVKMNKIYYHTLNGTALSSNPGKQIKDNTQIYILTPESTDTTKVNATNGTFTHSWTDKTPVTSVKVGGKNVPGHLPNEITANIDDNESAGIMFNAKSYSLSQPIKVKNQYSEAVSGAQVAGGDATKTTDATGIATITKNNLETDINNLPLANYALPLTVTKSNIQTLNQTINSKVGTNLEQILNVIQNYKFSIVGTSTSPTGTIVKGWKDGTVIQTATVNGTAYETNQIEKTTKTFTLDSLTFEKSGYTTFKQNNVTLVEGTNKKEATLQPIQQYATLNFTLKVYLQNGEIINTIKPNASNTFQWPDGTTNTYPVNANGEIVVSKLLPINNGSFGTATFSIDTTDYNGNGVLPWMIFRQPHQKTNRANIAQNQSTNLVPAYNVVVPLDSLANKTIYEYTVTKNVEGQPGTWYRMDKMPATGFMRSSGDGKTSGFIELPQNVAPYLDFVQLGWNLTTNLPVPQADLDRSDNLTKQVIAISYKPNGDTLLPPHRIYTIASLTDPRAQTLAARNWDNSVRSAFDISTPGNTRQWIATYSYNGEPRIWRTAARYNTSEPNAILFAEKYSATYGIEEGTGDIMTYIYNFITNQPTKLAEGMATMTLLLELGTH